MERRKILEENLILNYINVNNLNLEPYKNIINELSSIKTGPDKLLFMTNYLEHDVEVVGMPFDQNSHIGTSATAPDVMSQHGFMS